MNHEPKIDIELKAKTVWLRNLNLFSGRAKDQESLFEYIKEITGKDASLKFTVDGLKINFFTDIPITGFVEPAFSLLEFMDFLDEDEQEGIVHAYVVEALKAGLFEEIIKLAKNSAAQHGMKSESDL